MSSIQQNVSEERAQLCSDDSDDMAEFIADLKKMMGGTIIEQGIPLPRYGLISLKVATTPIYVYDHPAFMKITNTAFTDGVHIFVCAKFLRKLVEEEEASSLLKHGAEPLIMHEVMHMLLGHVNRLRQFPKDIANKAEDLVINAKLQLAFKMEWTKTLSEVGLGFKPGDAEKYSTLAEETVARQLMAEMEDDTKKKKQDQKNKGNNQQKQQGGGSSGGQSAGSGSEKNEGGEQGGQGDQEEEWSDMHTIPLEDLIKTLEENGLEHIKDILELPASDNSEEIAKIEENIVLKDIELIEKAAAQKAQVGGKYPGSHIVDAAAERIKGLTEGKLSWKLGLKEWILGSGMNFRVSDEEADMLYHIDPAEMSLSDPIYVGSPIPHAPEEAILCLLDTSGSVDQKMMKEFISEVLTLKKGVSGVSDTASKVILLSADTVLRGEALEITEENVDSLLEQGVNVFGRGGTDLANSLDQSMKLDLVKSNKITAVVYFTDLCDFPPPKARFQDYLDKGIKFVYVTTPHMRSEEFIKGVKDYARVYVIEEGTEVDLSDTAMEVPVNTRGAKGLK